jgi:hypothetical protein
MDPYLQPALSFLNVLLKQRKAQLCLYLMSVTPCGLLPSAFTTIVPYSFSAVPSTRSCHKHLFVVLIYDTRLLHWIRMRFFLSYYEFYLRNSTKIDSSVTQSKFGIIRTDPGQCKYILKNTYCSLRIADLVQIRRAAS